MKLFLIFFNFLISFFCFTLPAKAVDIGANTPLGKSSETVSKFNNFGILINLLLKNSLTIAGIILIGLLIFGGINYIIGAGEQDQKKIKSAGEAITSAIIGFIVIFCAFFIIQIIKVLTGLDILNSGL